MPITRTQKEEIIRGVHQKATLAKVAIFLNFHGLKTKDMNQLRATLRKIGADVKTVKKTLLKKVLGGFGFAGELPKLDGEIAVMFGYEEAPGAAKIVKDFARKHDGLKIVGGILAGQYMLAGAVKRFAEIPPREVLLAQLLGVLNSPMARLSRVLSGPLQSMVGVINQLSNKK